MNPAPFVVSVRAAPACIQGHVSRTLERLREHHRVLTAVAYAHGRSNGYHLSLEVRERLAGIDSDRARLALFRQKAHARGVDASAVLTALGGEPDFGEFKVPPFTLPALVAAA